MSDIKVSLFASAVRPQLWPALFKSLKGTSVEYDIVFSGDGLKSGELMFPEGASPNCNFTHIRTERIKPAQCYELARRHCTGETVVWVADDCEFPNNVIGKAYEYWKSQNNEKLILSLQTKESGYGQKDGKLFPMKEHTFYSSMVETPLMAPIALMSRKFLDELGGIDQRYVCGQYENDIVMRAYQRGAKVEIFGDENMYVDIDHLAKSIAIGESTDEISFLKRPFAMGYSKDREVLEHSWTTFDQVKAFKILQSGQQPFSLRTVSNIQLDEFQPYPGVIPLDKSLSNRGAWD